MVCPPPRSCGGCQAARACLAARGGFVSDTTVDGLAGMRQDAAHGFRGTQRLPRPGRGPAAAAGAGPAGQAGRPWRPAPAAGGGGDTSSRARRSAAEAATRPPTAVDVRVTGFGGGRPCWCRRTPSSCTPAAAAPSRCTSGLGIVVPVRPGHRLLPGRARRHADDPASTPSASAANCRACWSRRTSSGSSRTSPPPTASSTSATRRPDAPGQPAAQGAGRGGDQGQGRHHERARGAQRQAAHHRGADRPPARRSPRAQGGSDHRAGPADRHRADQGGRGQLAAAVGEPAEAVPLRAGPARPAGRARRPGGHHRPGAGLAAPRPDAAPRERARTRRPAGPQRRRDLRPGRRRSGCAGPSATRPTPARWPSHAERDHPARAAAGAGSGTREETEMRRLRLELEQTLQRLTLDDELAAGPRPRRAAARRRAAGAGARPGRPGHRQRALARGGAGRADRAAAGDRGKLPKPNELRTVNLSGADGGSLSGIVAELAAAVTAIRSAVASRE